MTNKNLISYIYNVGIMYGGYIIQTITLKLNV